MPPRISVVVPTHDRRDSLLRLLGGLAAGTYPHAELEVIIVADGCSDDTATAVRCTSFPFAVHVVEQSPGRGAGAARNLGAAHAGGTLLVFLDDDIEPLPTLLDAHERAHADAPSTTSALWVVVGSALPVRATNSGFHELSMQAWWEQQFQRMATPGHRFSYADVLSGNCSIAAASFARLGGFDATLPESCRDDFELGLRLIAADARITFAPPAGGVHHDATDRARLMRRKRAEGYADVILARRHPGLATALPLGAPMARRTSRLALLRRLAFAGPLGALPVALWTWQLDLLEALRLRGRWRWLQEDVQSYWYWRGVADAAGERSTVDALLAQAAADLDARAAAAVDLDLRAGLTAAERRLDETRPDVVWLRYGPYPLGTIAPRPGAERLRGVHLRALVAEAYAGPLLAARLLDAASDDVGADDVAAEDAAPLAPAPCTSAGEGGGVPARWPQRVCELEITDPVAPIEGCAGHASVRVLARHHGRPLGWLTLEPSDGVVTAAAVRRALVAQLGAQLLCTTITEAPPDDAASLPPISVVVCTRDRAASLEGCVQALCALDYPTFEIVVIDNAPSTDAAREVAMKHGVRYVREDRPGLDWARNRAIAEARHELIAFTDDDVRVDARWLRGLAGAFADPDVGAVTGLVAPVELATRAQVLFELHYGGMGKGVQPRVWDPAALPITMSIAAQHIGVGANMAFRRRVLAAVGGFDVALDVGTPARGAGDLEMFHRLLAAGVVVRYEPTALVWHRHRREMAALRRQLYDNGRSFGVYLITIWRRGAVPRPAIAFYAVGRWGRWLVARLLRRALGREPLPASLLWAELWGATHAPWAHLRTILAARSANPESMESKSSVGSCESD